jgi:hypothetical protein
MNLFKSLTIVGLILLAGCHHKSKSQLKTVIVTIQDEQGMALKGAKVTPYFFRCKSDPGSSYGWVGEGSGLPKPRAAVSDENGKVALDYPEAIGENHIVSILGIAIKHPSFCSELSEVAVEKPEEITLKKGMHLSLSGLFPESVKGISVYPDGQCDNFKYSDLSWIRGSDNTLSTELPRASFLVRAIGCGDGGRMYFSSPELINSTGEGEKKLELQLRPGTTIRGILDKSVPRPVKNGVIVACVLTASDGSKDLKIVWEVSVDVAEDGSFTLPYLPSGELQMICIAEGYVSKDEKNANPNVCRNPQSFSMSSDQPVTLKMEPTGTVRVHVLDPNGNPLANAYVALNPNQIFNHGSSIIGRRFDSAEFIKNRQENPDYVWQQPPIKYNFNGKTDHNGIVVIHNIPSGKQNLTIKHEAFDQPIQKNGLVYPRRSLEVQIKSGIQSDITVTMEKKDSTSLAEAIKKYAPDWIKRLTNQ